MTRSSIFFMTLKYCATAWTVALFLFLTPDYCARDSFKAMKNFKATLSFYILKDNQKLQRISDEHCTSSGSETFLLPVELDFALKPSFYIPGCQWNVGWPMQKGEFVLEPVLFALVVILLVLEEDRKMLALLLVY